MNAIYSGSGKSTATQVRQHALVSYQWILLQQQSDLSVSFYQLLLRFYDPTSGSVKLDGNDLKSINVKWLRQNVGMVNQVRAHLE